MKKILLPALLLLAVPASATKVSWTGTVNGNQDIASGSFEYANNLLWSADLSIGAQHYIFMPQYFAFDQNGPLAMSDVPLLEESDSGVTSSFGGDLQWNTQIARWWFGNTEEDGVSGKISSFIEHDAAPTPEPSTVVLMGSALLGLGGFRWFRRNARRLG